MPGRARLTRDQRDAIEDGLSRAPAVSWAELASRLGVAPTTVAREVSRNRGRVKYCAETAQRRAEREARRPRALRLAAAGPLRDRITAELKECRSPAAIAADLAAEHGQAVCTETIYRAAYAGVLEVRPRECLRRRRAKRRGRQARHESKRPGLPNIESRPARVNDRSELGHWEGDLVIGAGNRSAVLTLIERTTRYGRLVDLPEGYGAEAVLAALVEAFDVVPEHLRRSLTFDQGSEWAHWQAVAGAFSMEVWFCNPHSPWERGAIENFNGHARFWLPRGARLDIVGPAELGRIEGLLNGQRRRALGWESPAALYSAAC